MYPLGIQTATERPEAVTLESSDTHTEMLCCVSKSYIIVAYYYNQLMTIHVASCVHERPLNSNIIIYTQLQKKRTTYMHLL